MTLRVLVDVNLSPDWVPVLNDAGFEAMHWVQVGDPSAPDREIMEWAVAKGYLVFSHDLVLLERAGDYKTQRAPRASSLRPCTKASSRRATSIPRRNAVAQ